MRNVLCKFFGFLKYILLVVSFGLVFYCLLTTYARLDKSLVEGISVFVPFVLVLFGFLISLVTRAKYVSNSLMFNFVASFVFITSIVVCLRAIYDTNMFLYYKYEINFNPSYFSDNLSFILIELYMLFGANVILLIASFIDKDKKKKDIALNDEKRDYKNDLKFEDDKKDECEDKNIIEDEKDVIDDEKDSNEEKISRVEKNHKVYENKKNKHNDKYNDKYNDKHKNKYKNENKEREEREED